MHAVLAVRHEDEMEGMLPIGLPSTSMRTSPRRPPSGTALYDNTAPQRATIPTHTAKENEPGRTISNGRAYFTSSSCRFSSWNYSIIGLRHFLGQNGGQR